MSVKAIGLLETRGLTTLVTGTDAICERAFLLAFRALDARIRLFLNLPFEKLSSLALQRELDAIGRSTATRQEP